MVVLGVHIPVLDCSKEEIWCSQVCLTNVSGIGLDDTFLLQISHILEALWLTHWQCATSSSEWSTPIAMAKLQHSYTAKHLIIDDSAESVVPG